jgi:hypothetical protein
MALVPGLRVRFGVVNGRGLLLKDLKARGLRHTSGHDGLLLKLWHLVPSHGGLEVNSFKGTCRKI